MDINLLFFRLKQYISYLAKSKGISNSSDTFISSFYNEVIRPSEKFSIQEIESVRKSLKMDLTPISFRNFKTREQYTTSVQKIAKTSLSDRRFSSFLYHLSKFLAVDSVLEAGTCLGINTQYLAATGAKTTTLEGVEEVAQVAQQSFLKQYENKINVVVGDVYETFERELNLSEPQLIFVDADHRGVALDFYLKKIQSSNLDVKCIVLHDIYWSKDMMLKWREIVQSQDYGLTIDLFHAGVLFPKYQGEKQHLTVKF